MSMFTVTGQVVNTFMQSGRTDKDTGEIQNPSHKVQIMGEMPVSEGGSKFDLITLTIPEGVDFSEYLNKRVSVPLGFFSPQKGQIIYFIPKGAEIVPASL